MNRQRGPLQSYGKTSDIEIDGRVYHCASQAERRWLEQVAPGLEAGDPASLVWQPPGVQLHYKHGGYDCSYVYRPDAYITWADGDEWTIEIKRGAMHQKAATKLKRYCQQNRDKKLVLVWFGSWPKKGVARRRLDMLEPWLDHVWRFK